MNITSVLPPLSTTTSNSTPTAAVAATAATATTAVNHSNTMSNSSLSNHDRNFVEFTRCLYKVKLVVHELEVFSHTVQSSIQYNYEGNGHDLVRQVQLYLEESFKKFNHMCHVLLVVLSKLEHQTVKKERIDSFRQEVMNEWRKAILVRQDLVQLVQRKHKDRLCQTMMPSPSSQQGCHDVEEDSSTEGSESNSMTPEPKSSQELPLHSSSSSSS
ncbi:hypothetical protein BD560DRAFT_437007 [Blakeslea trispora]|nr:hypothetical protein BD560DRAFT_437007 [Blakeslea trispora]